MADDWDLLAVVRSCSTTTNTTTTTTTPTNPITTTTTTTNKNPTIPILGDPLSSFVPWNLEPHESPCQFPDLMATAYNPLGELQGFCKPHFPEAQPILPQTSINPTIPLLGGSIGQQTVHQMQQLPQQQGLAHQFQNARPSSAFPFRPNQPHLVPRPRRRRIQQKRMVSQVTAESLFADMWAWRKYGQKPIKGSAHPRNYYRCSSSKGCAARKQVERSPSDPNMFLVTYTGDHTHPRPTHRSSLSCSNRSKFLEAASNSPISVSGLSPATPSTTLMEDESASLQNTNNKGNDPANDDGENINVEDMIEICSSEDSDDGDGGGDEVDEDIVDDDEDILIPNMVMSEDIFMGLQELGRANDSRSPSGPSSSATADGGSGSGC